MRVALFLGYLLISGSLSAQSESQAPTGEPTPVAEEVVQPTVETEAAKSQNHSPDMATPPSVTPLPVEKPDDEEPLSEEQLSLDPLEFTQKEHQTQFPGGIAFNVGPVMPWSEYGASLFWARYGIIQSFTLGAGGFEFSDNYRERNYRVKADTQSLYYAARWFVLGFGPLYVEPFAGFARWSGSIKPSGYDNVNDSLASALDSRFDINGVSLGANLGIMWIFDNGFFVDYNLLNLSSSAFVTKTFTTNTEEAKKSVKKELAGPLTMSNLHLRIGYSLPL